MSSTHGPDEITTREAGFLAVELQDARDVLEATERSEVRELGRTMMIQIPIMVGLISTISMGGAPAFWALAAVAPLEFFLFRRLARNGDRVRELKAQISELELRLAPPETDQT